MIRFSFYITLLLQIILVQYSVSAKEIVRTEPADWVKRIEYPKETQVSKYDIKSGVYYKLIDYQTNFQKQSSYSHFVQNILTSGGVTSVSQLQLTYDSSYQQLNFHQLTIWRNGQAIDKTNDISFEYIKNEQELQSSIYSGLVTALVVIDDLRKNDLLEIAYTLDGNNPVYEGAQYQLLPLEDINPIDKIYVRMVYPSNKNYTYQCTGCDKGEVAINKNGELSELELTRENLDAVELEESMPPWIIPYDYMEMSSTNSWETVNNWALSVFEQNDDDQIDKIFDEIFYQEYGIEEKIDAIINFAQDEIRYMGIETGMGNIKPFSPNQTINQRFGDCKDKSLLMVSMLKKIGIQESYPVLVNSSMLHKVSQFVPSGQVFNHCIVYFKYKGNDYWVDPTYSHQGGTFKSIVTFDYETALIVKEGTKELTPMNIEDTFSKSSVVEVLDISSFDQPGTLKINATVKGYKADYTRQILEYYSRKDLAESYRYSYGLVYPTLQESKKLSIIDSELENTFETEENYTISNTWNDGEEGVVGSRTASYEPANLYGYIYAVNCEMKKYPVYFDFPIRYEQTTIIKLPETLTIEVGDKQYDNAAFSFNKEIRKIDSKTIEIRYEFETKAREIAPEDFPEVCQDLNDIMKSLSLVFAFPKVKFPELGNLNTNSSFNFSNAKKNLFMNGTFNLTSDSLSTISDTSIVSSKSIKKVTSEDSSYKVDDQPSYPGGMGALYKHLNRSMNYPKEAKENGISGRVFVSFIVSETGELKSIEVTKGIGYGCDKEAVRVLQTGKNWNPGQKDGENVAVRMLLPITFKL